MEGPQKTDEKEALNSEEQYGWNVSSQETVALLIQVTLPTTPRTQEGCGDHDSGGLIPGVNLGSAT